MAAMAGVMSRAGFMYLFEGKIDTSLYSFLTTPPSPINY